MGLKIVFLSYSIDKNTPAYGNGDSIRIDQIKKIENGDSCNASLWHLPNHLGTHVDAPKHFFQKGPSIDFYTPDFWIFQNISLAHVSCDRNRLIDAKDLMPFLSMDTELLLVKKEPAVLRGCRKYWEENYGLSPDVGYELRSRYKRLRVIGVDSISISSWQNRMVGQEAHRTLLDPDSTGNPILLIEDMDLSVIHENTIINKVIILPLRIKEADGAPCSIIAEVQEDEE